MANYNIDKLITLSCNIDDFNPQNYEYITEKLFQNGALDVWLTPIYMKKISHCQHFICINQTRR